MKRFSSALATLGVADSFRALWVLGILSLFAARAPEAAYAEPPAAADEATEVARLKQAIADAFSVPAPDDEAANGTEQNDRKEAEPAGKKLPAAQTSGLTAAQITELKRRFPGAIESGADPQMLLLRSAADTNRRRWAAFEFRRRLHAEQLERDRQAQLALAVAQARAQAAAQQRAPMAPPQRVQPVYVPLLPPAPYSGPFYETVQHTGNQTWVTGSGPYGPFSETISRTGNQTWINGSGPFGPFSETIQRNGNQTFVNGSGVPPGAIGPWAGGYGGGGFGGGF